MELVLRSNWHYCPKFSSISFFIAPTKWTLLLARCFSDFSFACDHFLPNPKYHAIRCWRFGALRCAYFFFLPFLFFTLEIRFVDSGGLYVILLFLFTFCDHFKLYAAIFKAKRIFFLRLLAAHYMNGPKWIEWSKWS